MVGFDLWIMGFMKNNGYLCHYDQLCRSGKNEGDVAVKSAECVYVVNIIK